MCLTDPGSTYLVTTVYSVDLSSGQFLRRHVVCTIAVRYDSGICKPDSHITTGSPSSIHVWPYTAGKGSSVSQSQVYGKLALRRPVVQLGLLGDGLAHLVLLVSPCEVEHPGA